MTLPLLTPTATGALAQRATATTVNALVTTTQNSTFTSVKNFGARGDGTTDDTAALTKAIGSVAATGGVLYFPPGIYKHTGLIFKNKVTYLGSGRDTGSTLGTVLLYTGTGDGVQVNNPINSSTAANISVEGIAFKNANVNSGKGCFADTGSTDIKFHQCAFIGSDRGLILDQTELADVIECDFEGVTSQTSLLWIVNGADRNLGASGGFSNRISVQRCQLDGKSTTTLIADDGGTCHTFSDNNYNGGSNQLRAAGVNGLIAHGGEWESGSSAIVLLTNTNLAGAGGPGSCDAVSFISPYFVPTPGQACVNIVSAVIIGFSNSYFGNTTSAKVTGTANAVSINSLGAHNAGGGATFDGMATGHFEIGHDGSIHTNLSPNLAANALITLNSSAGAGFETILQKSLASPFSYYDIISKGGAGGWQGSFRVRLSYNNGSQFDALKLQADTTGSGATLDIVSGYKVGGTLVLNGQMAHIANLTVAPTAADFNGLLAALQGVKLMA